MKITFKKADINDVSIVNELLKKLAEYEKMADLCKITDQRLAEIMEEENGLSAIIAMADGKPVGLLTYYFFKIATFSGMRVLYVEDVFVESEYRNNGIGTEFFNIVKSTAVENNCARIEWKCLKWNTDAQKFYEKYGGKPSDEWLTYTLELNGG